MPRQPCPNGRCPQTVGNPIDPATGVKFQKERDYTGADPMPLQFERFYNSFGAGRGAALGSAWHHTFDRSLTVVSLIGSGQSLLTVRVNRPDGQVLAFQNSSGTWQTDGDTSTTLTGNATSGYTYTDDNDTVEAYDVDGRLLSIRTRSGITQTLNYNGLGQLASVTDAFGRTLTLGYYANGLLNTLTDPAGGLFTYGYDATNRLISVSYPDLQVRQYLYNESAYTSGANLPNALTGIIDESGQRLATYTYDVMGRAISTQHAGGAELVSVTYNSNGSATVTDALGATRTYSYTTLWNVPRLQSITGQLCVACGEYASYGYDARGNIQSWSTAAGTSSNGSWTTDGRNLLTNSSENIAGPTRTVSTQWHATFRLPTLITQANRKTSFTYDPNGNALTKTISDVSGSPSRTWTYTYNGYGQVLTADGPRTDVSDLTTYTYYSCITGSECGQLHTVTDAVGNVTTYNSYSPHGQPLTITDPNGVVTTLTYDARQRLTSRQMGTETTTFDYWPTGLLKKVTLPDASYLLYTYDAAHQLTQISDGFGNAVDYTLDAMGNRTAENTYDPSSVLHRTHTRVINALNQLINDVNAAGTAAVTTTFGYDADGNQTTIHAPLSRNTTLTYDGLNRTTIVTDPANGQTSFGYDAYDQLVNVWDPRNRQTTYTYNTLGDLTKLSSPDAGTTTNTYDSAGNLATATDARGAVSTYSYDALNRLTSIAYSQRGTTDQTVAFNYDAGTNGKGHLTGASDANGLQASLAH
jgi:YD repeat-containing protein